MFSFPSSFSSVHFNSDLFSCFCNFILFFCVLSLFFVFSPFIDVKYSFVPYFYFFRLAHLFLVFFFCSFLLYFIPLSTSFLSSILLTFFPLYVSRPSCLLSASIIMSHYPSVLRRNISVIMIGSQTIPFHRYFAQEVSVLQECTGT